MASSSVSDARFVVPLSISWTVRVLGLVLRDGHPDHYAGAAIILTVLQRQLSPPAVSRR